jgi:hypothetical protein
MSDRITEKNLKSLVDTINHITNSPTEQYTQTEGGYRANVGNYHLSFAYGGVTLHRMVNDGGGVTTPLGGGYFSKRELYFKMHAFINGIEEGLSIK